jgi:hypothetical protein
MVRRCTRVSTFLYRDRALRLTSELYALAKTTFFADAERSCKDLDLCRRRDRALHLTSELNALAKTTFFADVETVLSVSRVS